jgi:hypothetical protein
MLSIYTYATRPRGSLRLNDDGELHFICRGKLPKKLTKKECHAIIESEIKYRRDHTVRLLTGADAGPEVQLALQLGLRRLRELNQFAAKVGKYD